MWTHAQHWALPATRTSLILLVPSITQTRISIELALFSSTGLNICGLSSSSPSCSFHTSNLLSVFISWKLYSLSIPFWHKERLYLILSFQSRVLSGSLQIYNLIFSLVKFKNYPILSLILDCLSTGKIKMKGKKMSLDYLINEIAVKSEDLYQEY